MSNAGTPKNLPHSAMVLAAGFGERMRPLTLHKPKPLIEVNGKALLDHALDRLSACGVKKAVVNVHYLADQIERHVNARKSPRIVISDERTALLDTGGGIAKALPELGAAPFFLINSDSIWIDGADNNLIRLADAFDPEKMDALLLLASTTGSIGYDGRGDFVIDEEGHLQRRAGREVLPFVYAGAAILSPALFTGTEVKPFSLSPLFDKAAEKNRLFGLRLEGIWMHVGTPAAIALAEQAIHTSTA